MVNAALHRLSTVPPYPSCNLVIILHKDLTTLIAWPYFGLIAAWFRATSHLHAYNRKKKTQRNEQNCGQPCGLVYALPFPQKDVGNSQIPAVKLCRMCPSSTWRQQTYYQLLGLTFLVRVSLHGSLQFKLRCVGKVTAVLDLQTVLFPQASEDEIRVAYKRLALVRLASEPACDFATCRNSCDAAWHTCLCRFGTRIGIHRAPEKLLRTSFRQSSRRTQVRCYDPLCGPPDI